RPGSQRSQLSFACQVPVRGLSVAEDKDWAKVHVSITALIKDAQGQVVDKLSKDLPYAVPRAKADELRRGVVSFTKPFRLPPGRYSVETAAVDRDSARAGVRRSVLVVSPAPNGLAASDLTCRGAPFRARGVSCAQWLGGERSRTRAARGSRRGATPCG